MKKCVLSSKTVSINFVHFTPSNGVKWTKLMQIPKKSGIDWRERRLIDKLYMDRGVKTTTGSTRHKECEDRKGVRQGCRLSSILYNWYSEYLTKEAPEGFGDLRMGGKIMQTVKYADDLVLQAKEETVHSGYYWRTDWSWKRLWNGKEIWEKLRY